MKPKPKNIIHEIFPAEKRLARIDKLELELDQKKDSMPLTEYFRAKQALTVRRLTEFRRIERANGWTPGRYEEPPEEPETVEPPPDPEPTPEEPETPFKRRMMHYAIFWGWLIVASYLITALSPLWKKM